MAISDARKRATDKYLKKLDEIKIRVPKGRKDEIKQFAESKGESLNSFIIKSIDKAMGEDSQ